MPTKIRDMRKGRAGEYRWKAEIQVKGERYSALMPDASRESYRKAVAWERETEKRIKASPTRMEFLTAATWANQYLDYTNERFARKTYLEKKKAFAEMFQVISPETEIKDFAPGMTLDHLRSQARVRSGYAANKDRKNLGTAWDWGAKYMEGWPSNKPNPFRAVDRFPEVRRPRPIPTEDDFWKVYDIAKDGQDKTMLLTFLHIAARRGEVFRLKVHDVDFITNRIRVITKKTKGGDEKVSWLPMTMPLKDALFDWIETRPVKSEYVFVCLDHIPVNTQYYGKPFKTRQHFMKKICKKAGVPYFHYHSIRHLTASILYKNGETVETIQSILRHENPNTTARYLHSLGLESARGALDRIARPGDGNVIKLEVNRKE